MHGNHVPFLQRLAEQIVRIRLPDRADEVMDDLTTIAERRHAANRWRVGCRLLREALVILVLGTGDPELDTVRPSPFLMYPSHVRGAIRSFRRQTSFALINVLGLAIAFSVGLIIHQYVSHESSYDRFPGSDSVYRVRNNYVRFGDQIYDSAGTFPGVGPTLAAEVPGVEAAARVYPYSGEYHVVLTRLDAPAQAQAFEEENLVFADQSLIDLFAFDLVRGQPEDALTEPGSVILSRDAARRHFGDDRAIGGRLLFASDGGAVHELHVTGIFERPGVPSHLVADVVVSWNTLFGRAGGRDRYDGRWDGPAIAHTYVRMVPGTASVVRDLMPGLVDRFKPDYTAVGDDGERLRRNEFFVEPIRTIHFDSALLNDIRPNGVRRLLVILVLTAVSVIAIAWLNYLNLAGARIMERVRELEIRRVLGSHRAMLLQQFMVEAVVMNGTALILAAGITVALQPMLTAVFGQGLTLSWASPLPLLSIVATVLLGAIVCALIPGMAGTRTGAGNLLGERSASVPEASTRKKLLISVQFATVAVLIVGTVVASRQMNYMLRSDDGVDTERVLVLSRPTVPGAGRAEVIGRVSVFQEQVRALAGVVEVTSSGAVPGQGILRGLATARLDIAEPPIISIEGVAAEPGFLSFYGIEPISGRAFRVGRADSLTVIFNRTASEQLGFASPEDALGRRVSIAGVDRTVIGVVEDFHQESYHHGIDPMFFIRSDAGRGNFISIRAGSASMVETLQAIRGVFDSIFPESPFEYDFTDDLYALQYEADRRLLLLIRLLSSIAIAVASLGLFGLSMHVVARRTREIAIRKVTGASEMGIVTLLARDLMLPVAFGIALSVPVSYIVMTDWLDQFAFRVDFDPAVWVFVGIAVAGIAFVSIAGQAWRAAAMRPMDALRHT